MAALLAGTRRAAPWFFATVLPCVLIAGCSGGSAELSPPAGSVTAPVGESPTGPGPAPAPGDNTPPPPPPSGPGAATDTVLSLAWRANIDTISGYKVYYGPTPDAAATLAAQLPLNTSGFNAQTPSVSFNAGRDLHLNPGDSVCFRLRAYNAANALSAWSPAVCSTI